MSPRSPRGGWAGRWALRGQRARVARLAKVVGWGCGHSCQAGRRRSFARQGLSDEASRSLVLVGVCGGDSALWGYGRKPPLTHILPHYHVTWRTPAAPPLGDAFGLAHPPLPVLRTGAARRLLKALCPFCEGCCCCRLRATGNAITPSPRDGGSYRVALQQYKSFWQDSTLDLCLCHAASVDAAAAQQVCI